MTDFRSMYDRDYIGSWDLPEGKDVVVTISKVVAASLPVAGTSKTQKRPILHFEGKEKGMVMNRTNGKTIAALYGPKVEAWIGKQIALYVVEVPFGSEIIPAIRVRPSIPKAA